MDDMGLDLPRKLGIEHLIGAVPETRRNWYPTQEVRPALPATIEELRLIDERRTSAHRLHGLVRRTLKVLARERTGVGRQVDVPAALSAQPIQLLTLVRLAPVADEIGVWIIGWPRLRALATRDRESLLREVPTREVIR